MTLMIIPNRRSYIIHVCLTVGMFAVCISVYPRQLGNWTVCYYYYHYYLLTAVEFPLGGSSPYTSTDKGKGKGKTIPLESSTGP